VITDVIVIIAPQVVESKLNLSANVTDNYQLSGVWIEITNLDGDTSINVSMNHNTSNGRYFTKQTLDKPGNYEFTILANDTSNNWASATGYFEIEKEEDPDEYNWKPIIALIFVCILLIVGFVVARNRPMKFTGDLGRDRTYSFLAGILPFVIAEAITGIVSLFTGLLAVPPLFGAGMIVDMAILIVGLICGIVIYNKGIPSDSYSQEEPQPETQIPPTTSDLDGKPIPPASPESPSPDSPPEIIPKEPGEPTQPEPEKEPPLPPPPPSESIPPPIGHPPFA
jgi:hypothetical protein